jgi:hypothetical protein
MNFSLRYNYTKDWIDRTMPIIINLFIPLAGGEFRKSLKQLYPPVKPGDDDITAFIMYYIGLL